MNWPLAIVLIVGMLLAALVASIWITSKSSSDENKRWEQRPALPDTPTVKIVTLDEDGPKPSDAVPEIDTEWIAETEGDRLDQRIDELEKALGELKQDREFRKEFHDRNTGVDPSS